ncbi:MAG: cupredoxin domain-containing protein [Dehalococcoidia bacterium]
MRSKLLATLPLTLGVLAAAACGGGYQAPGPAATTPPSEAAQGEVTVTATYPRFQPTSITVAPGETIRLNLTSTDTSHTFTIDELGINIAVSGGQTIVEEMRVEQAGTFTFYCTVPGHRGAGMVGTLEVRE